MSTDAPPPTLDELDALTTEELRERAFHVARERHDVKFFVQVIRLLPASEDAEDNIDGSLGSIGESITDLVGRSGGSSPVTVWAAPSRSSGPSSSTI